jgi:hypothetical protein
MLVLLVGIELSRITKIPDSMEHTERTLRISIDFSEISGT